MCFCVIECVCPYVYAHTRVWLCTCALARVYVCVWGGGKRLTERENDSKMYENLDGSDRVSRSKHPGL